MSDIRFNNKSVLLVFTSLSTFVQNDLDILESAHTVHKYHFKPVRGIIGNGWEIFKQLVHLLIFGWKYDLIFCWFADYHSLLPVLFCRIFRKKSIVVIGGYDVCRIRTLNYGSFCSPFRGWFSARSMRMADCILPVSGFVDRRAKVIAPQTKRELIFNCVNLEEQHQATSSRTDTILTVGLITNERTFYLKGIDTFLETARLLPGFRFEIVGIDPAKLYYQLGNLPMNVSLYGKIKPEELIAFYRNAQIYCQLSRSESFGISLAEAMYFGNYPIVTNEGGMPEVVGETGCIMKRDPQAIADKIKERILRIGPPDEEMLRNQVVRSFSKEKRYESLLRLINSL